MPLDNFGSGSGEIFRPPSESPGEALPLAYVSIIHSSKQVASGTANSENDIVPDTETRRLEDRIDAARRESDLRLEVAMAKIDATVGRIDARLDAVEKATSGLKATILATVIPTGVAIVAALIGILAYGQAWFGTGVSTRDIIRATVAEYQATHPLASTSTAPPR